MPSFTAAHWGVYEMDGAMTDDLRLRAFRHDPDPSPIGYEMHSRSVAKARILRPAVRRGWLEKGPGASSQDRGREAFVELEWDAVLDLLAKELRRVIDEHGNESIFGGSYGWASAGRFHHAQGQIHRFLKTIGGYVRHMDSYSLGAGRALMPYIVAPMGTLMAEHTDWETMAKHTQLFVTFGGVPAKNAQINQGGTAEHRARVGLAKLGSAGIRFVNISPIRTDLCTGVPVEWWPIRPNTDTALLLALAHTIYVEGKHDKVFLDRYCSGFDRFARYLIGRDDGQPKTAAWAAKITSIPAERIELLARDIVAQRTMLNMAWSLQRAHHGEQPFWALVSLAGMLGEIGLPGGGFGLAYGAENLMGSPHRKFRGPTFPQGPNPIDKYIPVARIADMLLDPGGKFTYCGRNLTYPNIRLVFWAGGNPFHHHQDLNRLIRAWRKPETVVVNEQYWTPLAKAADIVLPATTTLERDDIFFAYREPYIVAMKQGQIPAGEARDDYSIFSALAHRLGSADAFTEGLDARQWLVRMYDECREMAQTEDIDLPPFSEFWEKGLAKIPENNEPVVMLQKFRSDPEANPLKTPSGKIEIFSETIAGYQYQDCPGYPCWMEPAEWLGSDLAEKYPLHLISDQPLTRLHGQFDHGPLSMSAKIHGREPIWIHPDDAARRAIAAGDVVRVYNDRGACLAAAVITEDIRPSVVKLSTGAWFDPSVWDPSNPLEKHGNPNALTADRPASSFSQGCSAQTCLVEIEKFEGELPAITAHDLPKRGAFLSDGTRIGTSRTA